MTELNVLPAPPGLPTCRWRGPVIDTAGPRYGCSSPKLIARRGVLGSTCRDHCPFVDHEPPPAGGRPPQPVGGPGSELKGMLSGIGITAEGCACEARAGQMNAWGPAGCRTHRAEIVGWLKAEAKGRGWRERLAAGARAVASGLAFALDPTDPYGSLVDEAIRRAEKG